MMSDLHFFSSRMMCMIYVDLYNSSQRITHLVRFADSSPLCWQMEEVMSYQLKIVLSQIWIFKCCRTADVLLMWLDSGPAHDYIPIWLVKWRLFQVFLHLQITHSHFKLYHTFHFSLKSGPPSLSPCWTSAFNFTQLLGSEACKNMLTSIYYWPWLAHSL